MALRSTFVTPTPRVLNFRGAFKEAGFKLAGCLIWWKDSLVLGRSDYQWQHEPILYGLETHRRA